MLSTKADVDRHVAKTLAKLKTTREKNLRGYSVARLYFDVGDYDACIHYVSRYLSAKDNNAAAHNLLGQAFDRSGKKDRALAEFKESLQLDPNQNNLVLKVCELLADESIDADVGTVRHWVDRAGTAFPRHPTLLRLCQRLSEMEHADSAVLTNILREQVAARPTDPSSHARLLRHLIRYDRVGDAYEHILDVHRTDNPEFRDSLLWQNIILEIADAHRAEVLNSSSMVQDYRSLQLTAAERRTYILLGWKYSATEAVHALRSFDRILHEVAECNAQERSDELLDHFGAQFFLHAASYLLKRAAREQGEWREAIRCAAPLLLLALHSDAPDSADNRSIDAAHRKSQAGHVLLACVKNKKQSFLDSVTSFCSGQNWRKKVFKELFDDKDQSSEHESSYLLNCKLFPELKIRLPTSQDLQKCDVKAQSFRLDSLHLQVWIGLNYDKLSKMSSPGMEELAASIDNLPNCGPETLSRLDVDAFLYCTTLIAQQNIKLNKKRDSYNSERISILPAVLLEPLCTVEQTKWWESAERLVRKEPGSQAVDTRQALIRGIETIRCAANHGLDPYILSALGKIFSQRSENDLEKKRPLAKRAALYYSAALPLLEKLKDRIALHFPKKRLFNFTFQDFSSETVNSTLEECRLFLGSHYMDENDDERAIEILSSVKSPYGSFNLYKIHMKLADEQVNFKKESITSDMRTKRFTLLSKARNFIYLTSDRLKDSNADSAHPLSDILNEHIENVETLLSSVDFEPQTSKIISEEYSSDERTSEGERGHRLDSTPERCRDPPKMLNTPRSIEAQIRQLQKKDTLFSSILQQISTLLESNKIISDQVQGFKETLDDFKCQCKTTCMTSADKRKIFNSIDDVKCKVEELRDDNITSTSDLKKDISDLRKEFEKLKLPSASQRNEDDIYSLEESYRTNVGTLPYLPRVAGNPTAIPPHGYPLYQPNLYSLYSGQYPGLPQIFPSHLFQSEQSVYPELIIPPPPVVPPPQIPPTQIAPLSTATSQLGLSQVGPTQIVPPSITHTQSSTFQQQIINPPRTTAQISTQPAAHDYQIPLPANSQPVPPVHTTQTSTPNKFLFDSANSTSTLKKFGLFENLESFNASDTFFNTSKEMNRSANANKTRTTSERSNESFDPIPDFKPVVPMPAEIVPVTGEEEEAILFDNRAKLFRFLTGEWKERGQGQLKLLKNESTGKVRLLMRRDIVHTVCANHILTPEMNISPMKDTDKAYVWVANDYADEVFKLETLCVRFKNVDIGKSFYNLFNDCKDQNNTSVTENKSAEIAKEVTNKNCWKCPGCSTENDGLKDKCKICDTSRTYDSLTMTTSVGGLTFSKKPTFKVVNDPVPTPITSTETSKPNPFASFTFTKSPIVNPAIPPVSNEKIISSINNISEQSSQVQVTSGWGDRFKMKPGTWACSACYINNEGSDNYCIACEAPKEPGMPKKEKKNEFDATKFTFGIPKADQNAPTNRTNTMDPVEFVHGIFTNTNKNKPADTIVQPQITTSGWGDRFKPKADSWNCTACYITNEGSDNYCVACETPKEPGMPKKEKKNEFDATKFKFGIPKSDQNTSTNRSNAMDPVEFGHDVFNTNKNKSAETIFQPQISTSGWGDRFKPKPGSWNCTACYIANDSSNDYCVACENPKDPNMPKKEKKKEFDVTTFKFGIPKAENESSSNPMFQFGTNKPNANQTLPTFGTASNISFGIASNKDETTKQSSMFGNPVTNEKYDFVFKPKVTMGKSPNKTQGDDGVDEDDNAQEDDGHHIYFEPVIPMPDKVEVKTGEEDEEVLYVHRAKLFRFSESQWKECGVGDVKILQHLTTKKIRVVMRREPVLKICLNHSLTLDIDYISKGEKAWLFSACDFSTGEVCAQQFCIRFVNKDVAADFKTAIDKAKLLIPNSDTDKTEHDENSPENDAKIVAEVSTSEDSNEDIQFVSESKVTTEEINLARKLMLPDKFFAYKQLAPCSGCRGCEKDSKEADNIESSLQIFKIKTNEKNSPSNVPEINKIVNALKGTIFDNKKPDKNTTLNITDFAIPKSGSTFDFGVSQNVTATTTSSIFSNALKQPIFGTYFGSKAQIEFDSSKSNSNAFNSNADNKTISFDKPSFPTTATTQPAIFGGKPIESMSNDGSNHVQIAPTSVFSAIRSSQPSMFSGFLENSAAFGAPPSTNFKSTFVTEFNKNESSLGDNPWLVNSQLSATKIQDTVPNNDKSYSDEKDINNDPEAESKDIFFKPIIPLPDKVEVKTGEEEENILYSQRSKLYRFNNSEWKECGVGDVKILHHKETKKLRVLMRREPIMKVCLNHLLTADIEYTAKDEKSWMFSACDFSTGEIAPQQFSIRFSNSTIAKEFKDAIDKAINLSSESNSEDKSIKDVKPAENKNTDSITKTPAAEINTSSEIDNSIWADSKNKASFRGLAAPKLTFANEPVTSTLNNDKKPSQIPTVKTSVTSVPIFGSTENSFNALQIGNLKKSNDEPKITEKNDSIKFKNANDPQSTNIPILGNIFTNLSNKTIFGEKASEEKSVDVSDVNYFTIAAKQLQHNKDTDDNKDKEVKPFTWKEAGTPIFQASIKTKENENQDEYDPHYEPIVPMPDKIKVVTGEEDENVEFSKRAKLFRWADGNWKERGTGEIKVLFHPNRKTYRLLLRQEQVHKVVLNQLINSDLKLMPMQNSPRSFMWFGLNYTDDEQGALEKLAVRFTKDEFAEKFRNCIENTIKALPAQDISANADPNSFVDSKVYGGEEDCDNNRDNECNNDNKNS